MACCSCSNSDGPSALPDNSDWMSKLPVELHSQPLNSLAIPGSHDSFTAAIQADDALAPNCPSFARDLCKLLGPKAKDILYRWSVTQSLDFTSQLQAGIRYFDLRLSSKPDCSSIYLCHALYAQPVLKCMMDMQAFLMDHPKEVVLLDFNHFYQMSADQHRSLLEGVQEVFGDKLCPLLDCDSVTLELMWENNLQVIAFYHNDIVKDYLQFWPGDFIPSPWGNVYSTGKLIQFLEDNYQKGRPKDMFYVTQGILTPDTAYILKHLLGSLKDDLCNKVAPPVVNWLSNKKSGKQGINICILDYVEMADYITTVINLNSTRT